VTFVATGSLLLASCRNVYVNSPKRRKPAWAAVNAGLVSGSRGGFGGAGNKLFAPLMSRSMCLSITPSLLKPRSIFVDLIAEAYDLSVDAATCGNPSRPYALVVRNKPIVGVVAGQAVTPLILWSVGASGSFA
jgi:hypothetical protein